ncbi:ring-cleaving dioxygenase [Shouchella sp. JSM 1781072]|uniref:ring-cleaving dioxygenase n=1 Tax=Bacillaceae TaxID=186817 RepID=UPI000C089DCE|nr:MULTISPECIES: ring-cleaving dioxygenase [Bacillaceae]UTR05981.1 ring-cleaving dioxygenase [Alkalihalobacillus sp. LMS6]
MKLKGHHHVSSLTANAERNLAFYRNILGMRLVKKTVNQDNTSNYHLFYADSKGSPGTEVTFFEIPLLAQKREGTNRIYEIGLLVPSNEALQFWSERFNKFQVEHEEIHERNGVLVLPFQDPDGHRMSLVVDQDASPVLENGTDEVSGEHAIIGLGPATLQVRYAEPTIQVLTDVLGFTKTGQYTNGDYTVHVFALDENGLSSEIHVEENKDLPKAREGRGSVHHIAFRVETEEELRQWVDHIEKEGFTTSGFVDRYYFKSLYFREPNGILYELATDGPGFDIDEKLEDLGKELSLPPFLEPKRKEIEAKLKPLRT